MPRYDFPGGLRLAHHTAPALAQPIQSGPRPAQLRIPLRQHAGPAAELRVAVGEPVRPGQRLADAIAPRSVAVHAPVAGVVIDIVEQAVAGPDAAPVPHVVIATGGGDTTTLPVMDWRTSTPDALLARIGEAGVVGLGGAGYPTIGKLGNACSTLILNGAECEPYIACDEALLRERAEQVVLGGRVMARIIGATRVLLALEDSMHAAAAACEHAIYAVGEGAVALARVPDRYPQGGERQLIQTLTGQEVPHGRLPRDLGIVVQNVATAAAVWQAVQYGEPLTRRIVTVAGSGVRQPGNFDVAIGTGIADLIAAAGGYSEEAARLLVGGPMMGWALPHDGFAITKTSHCVLVLGAYELRDPADEMPCIRCGDCAGVCPARLQPHALLMQLRQDDPTAAAIASGLDACIECGACDLACPSHIPLTAHFHFGKRQARERRREREVADAARQRHLARQQRLVRVEQARSERQRTQVTDAASKDAVAAALERARARRQAKDTGGAP